MAGCATKAEAKRPAAAPPPPAPLLQRKACCARCAAAADEDRPMLQRHATGPAPTVPASVTSVLSSPGQPLAPSVRAALEPSFGTSLSHVRLHTDSAAGRAAADVAADAFTVGPHIAFAPGRYGPASGDGMALLAHEVAHTVQQGGLARRAVGGIARSGDDPVLEAQADRAAAAVLDGRPVTGLSRIAAPMLARAGKGRKFRLPQKTDNLPKSVKRVEEAPDEVGTPVIAVDLGVLKLPPEKGPVLKVWSAQATAGALEAYMQLKGSIRPELKQERPATKELRDIWKAKFDWPKEAEELWVKAGGDPGFRPKGGALACHMDHILELQFRGDNAPSNLQALDPKENVDSGRWLNLLLVGHAQEIQAARPELESVVLHFTSVTQAKSTCKECCDIEKKAATVAAADKAARQREEGADKEYKLKAGGRQDHLLVPELKPGKRPDPVRIADSSIERNKRVALLIAGLQLDELNRVAGGPKGKGPRALRDTIKASFDQSAKTRLPLDLKAGAGVTLKVEGEEGELSLVAPPKPIAFVFPYLSPGAFTKVAMDENGELSAAGYINVEKIKFLGRLDIALEKGRLSVSKKLDKKDLKSPLPGFTITHADIGMELAPELKPEGKFGFALGSGAKPLVWGEVAVSASAGVLIATGDLYANIPGLDEAHGNLTYRSDSGWEGRVELTTAKIPRVRSASVVATLSAKEGLSKFDVGGKIVVVPFGENEVTLDVRYRGGAITITGSSRLTVPLRGVRPVLLGFTYKDGKLTAKGHTGFSFKGLDGEIDVFYVDGAFSGAGFILVKKGRFDGRIDGRLDGDGRFSGSGKVKFQVQPNLILEGGIEVDKQQRVRLTGILTVPKPVEVFPRLPKGDGRKDLLKVDRWIPIPGLSIGTIGVGVDLKAGLYVFYYFGPGAFHDTKLEAALNPLEDDPDALVVFTTRFAIPGEVGIGGMLRGAIGVGAEAGPCKAAVTGGLELNATATLGGGPGKPFINAPFEIRYEKRKFSVEAKPTVQAALAFGLDLKANVIAEAGCFGFSAVKKWDWDLASTRVDTGLEVMVQAPIKYAPPEPFRLPSLDEITFKLPTLEPGKLLGDQFARKKVQ